MEEKPAHGTAFLEAVEITTTGQGVMIHMVLVGGSIHAFHSKTALCVLQNVSCAVGGFA